MNSWGGGGPGVLLLPGWSDREQNIRMLLIVLSWSAQGQSFLCHLIMAIYCYKKPKRCCSFHTLAAIGTVFFLISFFWSWSFASLPFQKTQALSLLFLITQPSLFAAFFVSLLDILLLFCYVYIFGNLIPHTFGWYFLSVSILVGTFV